MIVFFHRILIKDIKDNDQYDTPPVIVSLKKPAYKNSGSCRENRQERTDKAGFFHAPYSQKAEKQGEHYILIRKFQQTAVKRQDQRESLRSRQKEKRRKAYFFLLEYGKNPLPGENRKWERQAGRSLLESDQSERPAGWQE